MRLKAILPKNYEFLKMIFVLGLLAIAVASTVHRNPPSNFLFPEEPYQSKQGYDGSTRINSVALDYAGKISLYWWLDYDKEIITFKVVFDPTLSEFSWFAIGFSDYGELANADYCVLIRDKRNAVLTDAHSDESGLLKNDVMNDCLNFIWDEETLTLQYSRFFDTCDKQDYILEHGTTHVIWSRGIGKHPNPNEVPEENRGMIRTQLLNNEKESPAFPEDTKIMEVTVENLKVPAIDTLYNCMIYRMPDWLLERKHHIIQFESSISKGNEGLVHHMELFYCDAPKDEEIDPWNGSCFDEKRPKSTQSCAKVRSAWAMGAPPFIYPEEAGLSIGGPESNPYLMLEVHYNNPEIKSGYVDSSGIRIYLSPKIRKYEASIIEFGLEYIDKMMIPPKQKDFVLSGYCTAACTKTGLPEGGIIIFGSQLHTHLTGTKVITRHFRDGVELPYINYDPHYNTMFQEIRILRRPVHILPGDSLITSCTYNTELKSKITFGGHSIQDEMCVNYVHYYPASELEVCKSSVNTDALYNFYREFSPFYPKVEVQNKTVRENYNDIVWNKESLDRLDSLFFKDPISMQCNNSKGERFSGSWDANFIDPIKITYNPPKWKCPIYRRGYNFHY